MLIHLQFGHCVDVILNLKHQFCYLIKWRKSCEIVQIYAFKYSTDLTLWTDTFSWARSWERMVVRMAGNGIMSEHWANPNANSSVQQPWTNSFWASDESIWNAAIERAQRTDKNSRRDALSLMYWALKRTGDGVISRWNDTFSSVSKGPSNT